MNTRQKILQAMLETAREKTAQGAASQDIVQTVRQTRNDAKDEQRHGINRQNIQENKENTRRARGTLQEVMVCLGTFEERVAHTSRKHPQVGYIFYEGKKQRVCIGFWGDEPVWKLVEDDDEYTYCLHKTMRINKDPDYCGREGEEAMAEPKKGSFFALQMFRTQSHTIHGTHYKAPEPIFFTLR